MISLRDVVTGFGNRDPLAEVWRRDLRGGGSSAEITGTLPLYFSSRGKPLSDYRISGETLQDGTPSPDMPVDVVGCGVRTGNLFDKDNVFENYYLNNGAPTPYNIGGYVLSDYIPIASNTATISARITALSGLGSHWAVYDENKTFIRGGIAFDAYKRVNTLKVVDTSGAAFIRIDYATRVLTDCMLNLGSTALPYEPYGYKLHVTVNGTEYPIYLGQVETTRRIKKLVLTGEEEYRKNYPSETNYLYYALRSIFPSSIGVTPVICNELPTRATAPIEVIGINTTNPFPSIYFNFGADVMNAQPSGNTAAGLKEYLATQYANGTPVTVWYVLAEPETGIFNEPLHKIGDYADTISFAQAEVVIPTVSGANVLDMTATVKPSEVYIKGKGIKPTNNPNFENGG